MSEARTLRLHAGTPTVLWCDSCMTGSRVHVEFHTFSPHGVTRAMTVDRCMNIGHES